MRVPPRSLARGEEDGVIAPVLQVGAPREPDVRCPPRHRRDRPVEQRPASVELTWEERRILVLGRHQHSAPLIRREVSRGGETDEWPAVRVAGVDDQLLVAAAGDAGILDAEALSCRVELRQHAARGVDHPACEAVRTPRRAKMGETGTVLDANQKDGFVVQPRGGRIEDRIDGGRPARRREDRVPVVPLEQL